MIGLPDTCRQVLAGIDKLEIVVPAGAFKILLSAAEMRQKWTYKPQPQPAADKITPEQQQLMRKVNFLHADGVPFIGKDQYSYLWDGIHKDVLFASIDHRGLKITFNPTYHTNPNQPWQPATDPEAIRYIWAKITRMIMERGVIFDDAEAYIYRVDFAKTNTLSYNCIHYLPALGQLQKKYSPYKTHKHETGISWGDHSSQGLIVGYDKGYELQTKFKQKNPEFSGLFRMENRFQGDGVKNTTKVRTITDLLRMGADGWTATYNSYIRNYLFTGRQIVLPFDHHDNITAIVNNHIQAAAAENKQPRSILNAVYNTWTTAHVDPAYNPIMIVHQICEVISEMGLVHRTNLDKQRKELLKHFSLAPDRTGKQILKPSDYLDEIQQRFIIAA